MIRAVSFDLWDTIIDDDSDEAKRTALGLRSKREERRHSVWSALNAVEPTDRDRVWLSYDLMESAFDHVWKVNQINWTVAERMTVLLRGLGRTLPEDALAEVIRVHEEMEITVQPDAIEGVAEALAELSKKYELCVVSDAIVSPGRCLRQWLDAHGLLGYFSAFAFSDEVGHSKPHRDMFQWVVDEIGVGFNEMVHVGDREHNDIKGPHALGMKAILFVATRAADLDGNTADAVCERYQELPGIIDRLAGE